MGSNQVPFNLPATPALGGNLFGIFPLAENVPVGQSDAASFPKQLGISPNGYVWQANSTTPGDWSFASLLPGVFNVGNAVNQPNASAGNAFWYFFGNPSVQNSNLASSDGNLVLVNCNPYTSGSGLSLTYVGKTVTGTLLCQNSNGENIYVQAPLAGSFIITNENAVASDMPGVVQVIASGTLPLALVAAGGGGNFSYLYGDPVNAIVHIPKWVNGVFTPQTAGWIDAFAVNLNNGNVTIGCTGQTITLNGTVNSASGVPLNFTPANGGGIAIDASGNVNICTGGTNSGTAYFNNFICRARNPVTGPISLDLFGNGTGFNCTNSGTDAFDIVVVGGGVAMAAWANGSRSADNSYYQLSGDIKVANIGNGFRVAEGANAKQGTLTLNGTTAVVVPNTSVTANSRIYLTTNLGAGTVGSAYVSARTPGTSFSVKSTVAGDTSTVAYTMFEPA